MNELLKTVTKGRAKSSCLLLLIGNENNKQIRTIRICQSVDVFLTVIESKYRKQTEEYLLLVQVTGEAFLQEYAHRDTPRCDMVPKDELDVDSSNKISFLNKNQFFVTGEDTRYTMILNQKKVFNIYSLY
uniref:Ycf2 N-terminal domain-containing protein n=1 Tax=Solanum lycopersicum TaxID=4081 RepID=A0A3Q7G0E0_SOLLC